MAFTDFYMAPSGGSNLNSGSTAGASVYTSTAGNFDGTSVFTPTDGSTPASTVSVGMYVSLYNTADTISRCVAQVTAVGAGVNGTITVSTTIKYGTMPVSNSGSRALVCGGPWADLGLTATNGALNTGSVPQSTRINVLAGTYANTSTVRTLGFNGTTAFPLLWRGYKTTIGDQITNNVAVAATDIPSFTWTTGGLVITGNYQRFSNIDFTGTQNSANGQVEVTSGVGCVFYGCRIANTNATLNGLALVTTAASNGVRLVRCYLTATTTASAVVNASSTGAFYLKGCVIYQGLIGLQSSGLSHAQHCVFDSQASDGIKLTGGANGTWIDGCSFYGQLLNGINITALGSNGVTISNCYFSTIVTAATAAINQSSGVNSVQVACTGNAFFNCTANYNGIAEALVYDDGGTLASDAFTAPASHNFTIAAVGQNIGVPGTFENTAVYQGYRDPGAVQHLAAAAPGGITGLIMRTSGTHRFIW